ncbi:MAG: molybdenum cofactor biosynthesis protein MoaE [Promethearchaeota archaeon]
MEPKGVRKFEPGVYDKGSFDLGQLLEVLKSDPTTRQCGAIATFVGTVRESSGVSGEGERVTGMVVEANRELANRAIREICVDLEVGDVRRVLICHLEGEFQVGEDLVYVLVAGGHRRSTFEALEEAVDRYKENAAIWKKELYEGGGSRWIH